MDQPMESRPMTEAQLKRPSFLSTLCILTFIGSGLGVIVNLLFSINYTTLVNLIERYGQSGSLIMPSPNHYLVTSFLNALSLVGAVLMWGFRKNGFFLYTLAQILLVVFPVIILGDQGVNTFGMIITGLFIFLYALNLKELKR